MIRYSGIVPPKCDCSFDQDERKIRKRRTSNTDHGVIHHGNTFNITDKQREWIEAITTVDHRLYEYGKMIFSKQLKEVESDLGVKFCDSF